MDHPTIGNRGRKILWGHNRFFYTFSFSIPAVFCLFSIIVWLLLYRLYVEESLGWLLFYWNAIYHNRRCRYGSKEGKEKYIYAYTHNIKPNVSSKLLKRALPIFFILKYFSIKTLFSIKVITCSIFLSCEHGLPCHWVNKWCSHISCVVPSKCNRNNWAFSTNQLSKINYFSMKQYLKIDAVISYG